MDLIEDAKKSMQKSKEERLEEMQRNVIRKAHIIGRIFETDDGKKLMEILKEEFDSPFIFDDNPHKTNYNLGRRDCVIYLEQAIRVHKKEMKNVI